MEEAVKKLPYERDSGCSSVVEALGDNGTRAVKPHELRIYSANGDEEDMCSVLRAKYL